MAFPQANTGGSSYGQRPPAPVVNHFVGADGNAYVQTGDSTTGGMTVAGIGTPGTGEPAHAGGSTGLIGWARDILAKIAAFGTAGVPSANVISVQGPPNQYGSITFTGNGQALTLDCEGMGAATFFCRVAGVIAVQVELNFGNGIWQPVEYYYHTTNQTSPIMVFGFTSFLVNQWLVANTKGAKQIRLTSSFYSVTSTWDGVVSPYPLSISAEISGIAPYVTLPTVGTVSTVITPSNCSVYYTDTTTPLAANATFTGSSRTMAAGNNGFHAECHCETNSATDGFRIQSSLDGSIFTNTSARTTVSSVVSGTGSVVAAISSPPRTHAYYRIYFLNAGYAQSYFKLTSSQTPV